MRMTSGISRRQFVKGAAAAGLLAGSGLPSYAASAAGRRQESAELEGTEFFLNIGKTALDITGSPAVATTVNDMLPGPTLYWKEGSEITLHVTNNLNEDTSIHWHGIILPPHMDGVPDISFEGIKPGETFTYRFTVMQSGTFWYHSHSGFQEQTGVYGAIVIDPIEPDPFAYDRDYVVSLSDWSDEKPERIFRKLKLMGDYYNFQQRTVGDFFDEVRQKGFFAAFNDRRMWNEMAMTDRDLSDVTGHTYTFLMNGRTPIAPFRALFERGERIRLRFINSAAMTFFDVRIPGLKMRVVAADGNNVHPVEVDEFRIGVAETYDVIVEPQADTAYAIFAQSLDRSGYAAGFLTYDPAVVASIPDMDPLPILTHTDMGMAMHGMAHGGQDMNAAGSQNGAPTDHAAMDMDHDAPGAMPSMQEMNAPEPDTMDHSMMGHAMPDMSADVKKPIPVTPLEEHWGVQTTMRAENPQYRLNDPGVGLRNNGRRVLTYGDLRSLRSSKEDRYPDREIILHLTGNMERYMWSINGIPYADAAPLQFHYGERLRVTYINDTMMNHPMHLHGMWSDLETGDENHLLRKHTIVVQPGSKISFRVTVDAKGAWAYHCHLLYHMAGMFRKVVVS